MDIVATSCRGGSYPHLVRVSKCWILVVGGLHKRWHVVLGHVLILSFASCCVYVFQGLECFSSMIWREKKFRIVGKKLRHVKNRHFSFFNLNRHNVDL